MKPEEVIKYLEMVRPAENYSHTYSVSVGNIRHFGPGSQLNKDVSKAIDLAIQALEKQIAKKPVIAESAPSYVLGKKVYTEYKACGVCGDVVGGGCAEKSNYCSECGNKIDWSVEEW